MYAMMGMLIKRERQDWWKTDKLFNLMQKRQSANYFVEYEMSARRMEGAGSGS